MTSILHKFTLCCCNSGTIFYNHPSPPTLFDSTLQHVNIGLTPLQQQTNPTKAKQLPVTNLCHYGFMAVVESSNRRSLQCTTFIRPSAPTLCTCTRPWHHDRCCPSLWVPAKVNKHSSPLSSKFTSTLTYFTIDPKKFQCRHFILILQG